MEFRVLGPLEARVDGEQISLGGAKQRAVLAVLLLSPDEVISVERLDWIDTGDAFIGVGTWKVVRGTGEYAGITGSGRSAHVGHNHGNGAWYIRHDGFLTLP